MSWERRGGRRGWRGGGWQGGRRRARDCHRGRASGERERARGRWGAEALSALRYVGTLLNPERLGENAARGSKGLTPPPVLVQVKGVLLLHKTGQIRPQSVSRRTTMGSSICGPHLLSPGFPAAPRLERTRRRGRRCWAGGGEGTLLRAGFRCSLQRGTSFPLGRSEVTFTCTLADRPEWLK